MLYTFLESCLIKDTYGSCTDIISIDIFTLRNRDNDKTVLVPTRVAALFPRRRTRICICRLHKDIEAMLKNDGMCRPHGTEI